MSRPSHFATSLRGAKGTWTVAGGAFAALTCCNLMMMAVVLNSLQVIVEDG
jgi:hypothetical protein